MPSQLSGIPQRYIHDESGYTTSSSVCVPRSVLLRDYKIAACRNSEGREGEFRDRETVNRSAVYTCFCVRALVYADVTGSSPISRKSLLTPPSFQYTHPSRVEINERIERERNRNV